MKVLQEIGEAYEEIRFLRAWRNRVYEAASEVLDSLSKARLPSEAKMSRLEEVLDEVRFEVEQ